MSLNAQETVWAHAALRMLHEQGVKLAPAVEQLREQLRLLVGCDADVSIVAEHRETVPPVVGEYWVRKGMQPGGTEGQRIAWLERHPLAGSWSRTPLVRVYAAPGDRGAAEDETWVYPWGALGALTQAPVVREINDFLDKFERLGDRELEPSEVPDERPRRR